MTTTHPQHAATRADRESRRLLRLWVELTLRLESADAHDLPDANRLARCRRDVEDQLLAVSPANQDVLDALEGWSASLIHVGDGAIGTDDCLLCLRARLSLPADPLPYPAEGRTR